MSGTNLTDYNKYTMSKNEKLFYTAAAAAVIYLGGYIFYHSHIFSLLLCPLALLYPRIRSREIIEKRKAKLNLQFKDMLYSLSSSLAAGKSAESAFRDVQKDLSIIYPDPNTDIIREICYIVRRIEMNETVEKCIADLAARTHLEDIENFADVFHTCKRTGGNIVDIIRNTSNIINDKICIKQEIDTMLAARRFEQKILNMVPVFMILLLSVSAGDYIAPVFSTIQGRAAMTASIFLLGLAWIISKQIMDIRI